MSKTYIGVMSGTSLDAIDLVAVSFSPLTLLGTLSVDFPPALRETLLSLTLPSDNEIDRMGQADVAYGELVGHAVNELVLSLGLNAADITAVGCHGQTIRHRPEWGFSLQIGDPNRIAELSHIPVVADFRRRDMAAGGQGAPLVPAFHASVFQDAQTHRIVLNLGGIANISVLPANQPDTVYGFDTGPANMLMDAWCFRHTGKHYDQDGAWAARGEVQADILTHFLDHPYFSAPAPKSTGRELFNLKWLDAQLEQFSSRKAVDIQATLLAFTAQTVAIAITSTGLSKGEILMCGGGAFNKMLWKTLETCLPHWALCSTADFGLAPTWVEATAFAWLAQQRIEGKAGNLAKVTGAKGARVLGGLYAP